MKFFCFFIGIILLRLDLFGQVDSAIVFESKSNLINIGKQVYLLEDKEGKLSIEDIQKPEYQKQFKKSEKEIPNFNTTESKIWVKLVVANQTDERIYLEVAQALAWYIDFYKPDSTGKSILTTQTGMMRPFANREVDNNFFLFELPPNPQAQTYYFSIKSDFPLTIPLSLASKSAQMAKSNFYHLFFGGFMGLVLIMFFYNLFIAYSVRDKLYLYYCAYLFTTMLSTNFMSGNFGYQLNPTSYFSQYFFIILLLELLTVNIFLIYLLALSKKSFFYQLLVVFIILYGMLTGINVFTGRYVAITDIFQGFILLNCFCILVYSFRLYRQGNKNARFVVFGFSFYYFGAIIYVLQNFGLLVSNFFTINANTFGTSMEILLFSLALGSRINNMRKEKELAQADVLQKTKENEKILAEQNEVLAQKVIEKTKDLQVKNEALQTSEEELRQNMEELETNQEELKTKNEQLEDAFGKLRLQNQKVNDSIRYAQRIQNAILPHQDILANAFPEYFVIFKPKDVVSGDFYWYIEVENKKFLAIVDCTGHGVPGAFMSMIGNTLLYEIINAKRIFEPHHILEELHTGILNSLNKKEAKIQDGMDIALCCIESGTDNKVKVQFSGAKRPLYYFSKQELIEIQADRKSIGQALSSQTFYQLHEIELQIGDTLYMSTDGWIDSINPERTRFGSRQFKEMLLKGANLPLNAQEEVFRHILEDYEQGTEQRDDVLLVGVRV